MTWDQVRALARAGMDVESHGRHAPRAPDARRRRAARRARRLAQRSRGPARPTGAAIAYPVGRSIAGEDRIRRAIAAAGYRVGLTNATGVNRLRVPANRHVVSPIDPLDVRRLATCRTMSDAMVLAQVAIPQLAYGSRAATKNRRSLAGLLR